MLRASPLSGQRTLIILEFLREMLREDVIKSGIANPPGGSPTLFMQGSGVPILLS